MKTLTKILTIGAITLVSLVGCVKKEFHKTCNTDLNGDNKLDFVESFGNKQKYFINVGNNEYQEVKLKLFDGIPFFRAEKGYFSPWGEYLSDDGNIINLKSIKF